MANGRVFRGEVYWVCVDDSQGAEQMTGRPAVIISGNGLNEKIDTVIVAYLTSQLKPYPGTARVIVNGEQNTVLCNQIRTIDKQRLIKYICTLTAEEMKRVTGGLAIAMCVPIAPPTPVVKPQQPEDADKITLQTERDAYKRLYEKVLEQLVEIKLNADLNKKMSQAEVIEESPIEEEEEEEEVEVEFEPEPELIDINACSAEDLTGIGFSLRVANDIIGCRPYTHITDLKKLDSVTGIMYQLVERKICCIEVDDPVEEEEPEEPVVTEVVEELPPEPEETVEVVEFTGKVNINTATARELTDLLGMPLRDAYAVTGYRNKNGLFVALEELLEVSRISKPKFDKIKARITLGEEEVAEPEPDEEDDDEPIAEPESVKVNVNTANIYELMRTGLGKSEAGRIVQRVKKYGKFSSIDDLTKVDGITGKVLRKVRDRLEV